MLRESELQSLKKFNHTKIINIQNITKIKINDSYKTNNLPAFSSREKLEIFHINGKEISTKNKESLQFFSSFFEKIFTQNEVKKNKNFLIKIKKSKKIFICWNDCFKETFGILLLYLIEHKNFSPNAARKFLHLGKNDITKFRAHVNSNFNSFFHKNNTKKSRKVFRS